MNHIVSLHIEGFKKFYSLDIQFNEHMNILVGENEAGKSTILDAIRTVMNQQYRTADKSVLKDLFNAKMVAEFTNAPSVKTLPYIKMKLNCYWIPHTKTVNTSTGKTMAITSRKHRNLVSVLNADMMLSLDPVLRLLSQQVKYPMSIIRLPGIHLPIAPIKQ